MVSKVRLLFRFLSFYILGPIKFARRIGVNLGDDCRIYIMNWGAEPFLVSLGSRVTVTSGVKFITHDGSTCLVKDEVGSRYQRFGRINIGNDVFIGVNTIIMPGVNIGSNVVIGAGSVVNKDLESNSVYVGVPARKVSTFDEYANKVKLSCANNAQLRHISDYKTRVFKALEIQNEKSI